MDPDHPNQQLLELRRRRRSVTTTARLRELLDKIDAAYPDAVLYNEGAVTVLCSCHNDHVGNLDLGMFPDFWDFNAEDDD